MTTEFCKGLTATEKQFINDFYKKHPEKLESLKNIKKRAEEKAKKMEEGNYYTFTHLTKYASYEKIKKLVNSGEFKEGVHFIDDGERKLWTQAAIDKVQDTYCFTEKEKKKFESLYFFFIDEQKMSLNKLSIEISKIINKSERAVYAFFYTFFSRSRSKDVIMQYMSALETLKKQNARKFK